MKWLALDIGGANIKVADGERLAISEPFPLWQKPQQLAEALRALVNSVPRVDHVAATMTGELADCFATKIEGVEFIVQALVKAADGRHTRIYLTSGFLVAPTIALRQPMLAAASNWHALARFAARYTEKACGLLIDIGSTTCDVIPLIDGAPMTMGRTDPNRLLNSELIYTGVQRSPVCGVVDSIPWRGRRCPVAHELFATMWDAYVLLGDLPEDPQSVNTADGRPATKAFAHDRLARMICADRDMFTRDDAIKAAGAIARAQLKKVTQGVAQVAGRLPQPVETVVISGHGEFLARRMLAKMQPEPRIVSLTSELGPDLSRCASAHALAVIAREGL